MNLPLAALVFSAETTSAVTFDGTRGTQQKKSRFLKALEETGMIAIACASARVGRTTIWRWRQDDAAFNEATQHLVEEIGTQTLRDEVIRRGMHGTLEPVYHKGKRVGSIRRYSDSLLMFELKKRDPSYRDRFEVTGANGGPIRHSHDVRLYIPENGRDISTLDGESGELVEEADDRDQAAAGATRAILSLPG